MIDFYKFFASSDIQEASKRKIEDIQKREFVNKDFEIEIGGKKIKFSLPNDVRKQLLALTLAQKWLLDNGSGSLEDSHNTNIAYCELVVNNMLIDGQSVNDLNAVNVEDLKAYGLVYYMELLLPLSHRSAMKAEDSIRKILSGYLKQ